MNDPVADLTRMCAGNLDRGAVGHVTCVALKHEDRWINVSSAIVLTPPAHPIGLSGCWSDDELGFAVVRGVVDPQALRRLLHGFAATRIMRGRDLPHADTWGQDIAMERTNGVAYQYSEPRQVPRDDAELMELPPAGSIAHIGGGFTYDNDMDSRWYRICDRLPSWDLPARDMTELSNRIGLGDGLGPQTAIAVRVFSPTWVRLGAIELLRDERVAVARVLAAWPEDLERCRVIAIPPRSTRAASSRGKRIESSVSNEANADGWYEALFSVALPSEHGPWTMSLGLDGATIEQFDFASPSPRLVAHEMIDTDLELLRARFLHGKKDNKLNSGAFEEGVLWFLHVAGFAAVSYKDKEWVDVVGFLDDEHVVYVECTVTKPDGDKIAKVGGRAKTFAAELTRRGGKPIVVRAAVFTVAERTTVTDEQRRHASEHDDVVIACQEDLVRLLDLVRGGERGARLLAALSELTPPQSLGQMPWLPGGI